MIIAKTFYLVVVESAKFPEVCQEVSEAFFEEAPDLAECDEETFFNVWKFLKPSWDSPCDRTFAWSVRLLCQVFGFWKSTHLTFKRVYGGSQLWFLR